MQALNYCAHAVPALHAMAQAFDYPDAIPGATAMLAGMPVQAQKEMSSLYTRVAAAIHNAPKFVVPNYGLIFDREMDRGQYRELFRAPFGQLAIEFHSPADRRLFEAGDVPADKRIVLCMEAGQDDQEFRLTPYVENPPDDQDGILIVSVFSQDSVWSVYPVAGWLPYSEPWVNGREVSEAEAISSRGSGGELLSWDISMPKLRGVVLSEWHVSKLAEAYGTDNFAARSMRDLSQEALAAVDLCLSLGVDNGIEQFDSVAAPTKLNRKRERKGKPPLYEYKILRLPGGGGPRKAHGPSQGTHHASPRFHLRRGHLRRLRSGKVTWVRPTSVGDRTRGAVEKAYDLRSD